MQIEALRVFCDVARCRSFSQAAQVHELTQSAASQSVRQLEDHLGVQLIDRSTRPLQLTTLGQRFYEGCRELVEQYLDLEASIRSAQAAIETTVEVAAIYSVGLIDMGNYVERFTAEYPNARVHIDYGHPDRVHEKVLDGTADFGLVSFPRSSRKLEVFPWREEIMVLACSPSHRLAITKTVRLVDLEGEKFVAYDRALAIRRHVDRFLRDHGVAVEVACEFDNIETLKKAVEAGVGVALLPEPTFRREIETGALVAIPLSGAEMVRPLGIIQNRHHKLSSTALRFLDLLLQGDVRAVGPDHLSDGNASRNGTTPPTKPKRRRNSQARI